MKILANFARFVYHSNLLIGIATASLCYQTAVLLNNFSLPWWFYLLMFSNTVLQYALHDLFAKQGVTNTKPIISRYFSNRRYFIVCILITVPLSTFLVFQLHWEQVMWLIVLGILTIAYSFPILPFKQLRKFKRNGLLKLLVLVLVWTVATMVLPASYTNHGYHHRFWFLMFFRFFYMLAICIPFDVRDDITDSQTASHTLVSLFGKKGCFIISYIALAVAAALLIPAYFIGIALPLLLALGLSLIATAFMIDHSSRYVFSPDTYLVLDGGMILQSALVCIAMLIA